MQVLLLVNALVSESPQESPELQEADTLNESVFKLLKENKYDEALALAKRALEIRERLLPRNDSRIATSLNHVGDLHIVKKHYSEAREIFQRLLHIQEERFGRNDVNLTPTLDRLGVLHTRTGKME